MYYSHSFENTTDLDWNHYVGFVRFINSDGTLGRDELCICAEIYERSRSIMETSTGTLAMPTLGLGTTRGRRRTIARDRR